MGYTDIEAHSCGDVKWNPFCRSAAKRYILLPLESPLQDERPGRARLGPSQGL
jgi:hypothetical protein